MPRKVEKKPARLRRQSFRISALSQQVCHLTSDNQVLAAEVAEHKWKHILARRENITLRRQLGDAHKEIEKLTDLRAE